MQDLLDLKNIKTLRMQFQNKIKNNLLNLFNLDFVTRQQIADIDFENFSFSPDLYYIYFKSFINKNLIINAPTPLLCISNNDPIKIFGINPKESPADYYLSRDEVMRDKCTQDIIYTTSDINETKVNFERSIRLLYPESTSALDTNLLNSIAIYNGSEEMPTSASSIFCQGRIYVKNVGAEFQQFYYLDTLVHEVAHQYFNIINHLVNLISDNNQKYFSYTKNQNRPICGILHEFFVLYRLIQFYLSCSELLKPFSLPDVNQDYKSYLRVRYFQIPYNYNCRLEVYKQKLANIYCQLSDSAGLTAEGKDFIRYIKSTIFSA